MTGIAGAQFPITQGAYQRVFAGKTDAFALKLNAGGDRLIYSTYLGGSENEEGQGLRLDNSGNAYLTGSTESSDFPVVDAFQPVYGGRSGQSDSYGDAFVSAIDPTGSQLIFSSYLGGSGDDRGSGIAIDSVSNIYVMGTTNSTNFPITNAVKSYLTTSNDNFLAKLAAYSSTTRFIPIVLSAGGKNGSFYTSELTLTNRGKGDVTVKFTYTAAFGGGGGSATDLVSGGQQRIFSDALAYLRSIGIPIPDAGDRGGTLMVQFSNLASSPWDVGVIVRTTTTVAQGRAGLAYEGARLDTRLSQPLYLCGLRENSKDRSNLAICNMGSPEEGDIVLRLTVFSGDPLHPASQTVPDTRLVPGGLMQFNSVLLSVGPFSNGYVRVERISGTAPYYAYAVINDQTTSDGSFVPPVQEHYSFKKHLLILPVVVETESYDTELVFTNFSPKPKWIAFLYVADAIENAERTAAYQIALRPGEQAIIPSFVQFLREHAVDVGGKGSQFAGSLYLFNNSDLSGIFVGARTSTATSHGNYGVFYSAIPYDLVPAGSAWVYGMQQNKENRTNLCLITLGPTLSSGTDQWSFPVPKSTPPNVYRIELFDGDTGRKITTIDDFTVPATKWTQIPAILSRYAAGVKQGYAHVTRTSGSYPFVTYGVINDGGEPGQRSGDGAFISSSP